MTILNTILLVEQQYRESDYLLGPIRSLDQYPRSSGFSRPDPRKTTTTRSGHELWEGEQFLYTKKKNEYKYRGRKLIEL